MPDPKIWTVHDLWAKYEDMAMHFNDLLIRLRTQALAGVAVISAVVGIFTKTDAASIKISWEIAAAVFLGLSVFWMAIWIIDLAYYNRLLIGAVISLRAIEEKSKQTTSDLSIEISTTIESYIMGKIPDTRTPYEKYRSRLGIWSFYSLVQIVLLSGVLFCLCKEMNTRTPPTAWYSCLCF